MMNAKELIARAETLLLTREHIALNEANATGHTLAVVGPRHTGRHL